MAIITIRYYGMAQDIAGAHVEKTEWIGSLKDLLDNLYKKHPTLNNNKIRISYNLRILNQDQLISEGSKIIINDGDEIVFLPPFAGG